MQALLSLAEIGEDDVSKLGAKSDKKGKTKIVTLADKLKLTSTKVLYSHLDVRHTCLIPVPQVEKLSTQAAEALSRADEAEVGVSIFR